MAALLEVVHKLPGDSELARYRLGVDPTEARVAERLLAHLRRVLAPAPVDWSEPPARITGGYETRIYGFRLAGALPPFDGPLVLRLFLDAGCADRARFEATVLGAVAAQGYPVPRVHHVWLDTEPLGAAFLLMERVAGTPLFGNSFGPAVLRMPALLAGAQLRLHELDAGPVTRAIEAAGFVPAALSIDMQTGWATSHVAELGLAGLAPGIAWLAGHRPAEREVPVLCHGDFHPMNVLVHKGRVVGVIDWTLLHVKLASPAYDVGSTLALLSHGPVAVPAPLRAAINFVRRRLVAMYRRRYLSAHPLDRTAVAWHEALRCFFFLLEAAEQRLADLGRIERPAKPSAFAAPYTQRAVIRRFRALTGVTLALPVDTPLPDDFGA